MIISITIIEAIKCLKLKRVPVKLKKKNNIPEESKAQIGNLPKIKREIFFSKIKTHIHTICKNSTFM